MKKYLKFVGFLGVIDAVIGLIAFIVYCVQTKQTIFFSIFGVLTISLFAPAIGLALITLSDLIEDKEKIETVLIEDKDEDKDKDIQQIEFQLSSYDNTYSVKKAPFDSMYLTIPSNFNKKVVTKILNRAFADCISLKNIRIPDSITSIGKGAFENCRSLDTITIPDSVTNIDDSTFRNCKSLKSVIISKSITSIDSYAFYECRSLEKVFYSGTKEQWDLISIGDENSSLTQATIIYNYESKQN